MNTYELAFAPGCGLTVDPELAFRDASAHGVTVIRFWLWQEMTDSGRDFSRFDNVIQLARAHNIHLYPVFENWLGLKDDPALGVRPPCPRIYPRPQFDNSWYRTGYNTLLYGQPASYKQYVTNVVTRYKDEESIFAWGLLNEPHDLDAPCDPAFYTFFLDMTSSVRTADPNHLIGVGGQSYSDSGFGCPQPPDTYAYIYSLPNSGFVEYHDYDPAAMPADVRRSIDAAASIGKPVIAAEAGLLLTPDPATRATAYRAKLKAAEAAGVAGYILWQYQQAALGTDYYTVRPGDPMLSVLSQFGCRC